jgi:hypothetical protein
MYSLRITGHVIHSHVPQSAVYGLLAQSYKRGYVNYVSHSCIVWVKCPGQLACLKIYSEPIDMLDYFRFPFSKICHFRLHV